jgi:hypothetical protein
MCVGGGWLNHPDSDAELKKRSRDGRGGKGRAHAEKNVVSTEPRNQGIQSSGPRTEEDQ